MSKRLPVSARVLGWAGVVAWSGCCGYVVWLAVAKPDRLRPSDLEGAFLIATAVLSLVGLAASIGLLCRRDWGRRLYVITCCWVFVLIVAFDLLTLDALRQQEGLPPRLHSAMMASARRGVVVRGVIAGVLTLLVVWALSRRGVKSAMRGRRAASRTEGEERARR